MILTGSWVHSQILSLAVAPGPSASPGQRFSLCSHSLRNRLASETITFGGVHRSKTKQKQKHPPPKKNPKHHKGFLSNLDFLFIAYCIKIFIQKLQANMAMWYLITGNIRNRQFCFNGHNSKATTLRLSPLSTSPVLFHGYPPPWELPGLPGFPQLHANRKTCSLKWFTRRLV